MTGHDGGPAYPAWSTEAPFFIQGGQSLRDCFARTIDHDSLPTFTSVKAACEWIGREMPKDELEMVAFSLELVAKMRYAMADAMLAERERKST